MPDLPEEAVQAAAVAIERALMSGEDFSMACDSDEQLARVALEAAVPVLAAGLQAWRERAETAEATITRVRQLRDVFELNSRTIEGVAGRNFFELFVEELDEALDPSSLPPETPALPEEETT